MSDLTLTIGKANDGRRLAVITRGGHPQQPASGPCELLTLEVVDGWSRAKISDWFRQMAAEKPWETRQ